jgi:8-oxo-dGTP pyrophosphatase MutT (NUDIX family)
VSKARLFYIGIKALIENEAGEILLLKADITKHRKVDTPYWDIPGGRIDEGQTIPETLSREIEEETGITDLKQTKLLTTVISNHEIPLGDATAGLALVVYEVEVPGDSKIRLSPEHTAYEWVDKKEAAKRLSHKYPAEFTNKLV